MSYSASFGDNWNKCRLSAPLEVISACFSKLTLCTNLILGLESIHLDGWLTLYLTGIDDAQEPSERFVKYIQRVFICYVGKMFRTKMSFDLFRSTTRKTICNWLTNIQLFKNFTLKNARSRSRPRPKHMLHSRLGVQLIRSIYFMAIGLSGAEI